MERSLVELGIEQIYRLCYGLIGANILAPHLIQTVSVQTVDLLQSLIWSAPFLEDDQKVYHFLPAVSIYQVLHQAEASGIGEYGAAMVSRETAAQTPCRYQLIILDACSRASRW